MTSSNLNANSKKKKTLKNINNMNYNELQKMRPVNNMVLVRLNRKTDEILLEGGVKLYLETRFHKERNAPVTGEVIAVPDQLLCRKWMEWETEMELEVGAQAWWGYLDTCYALENSSHHFQDEDGRNYILVPYQSFVCQKIGDNIKTVNGYLLCEGVEEEVLKSSTIYIPDDIRKNKSAVFAILRYQGNRNTWYRVSQYHDTEESVCNGSVIAFTANSDIPLEYDLHQSIEGRNKHFYKMQLRDVLAVIPAEELPKLNIVL